MKEHLYFIAILPNREISSEVTQFKEYAAEHFDSSRALRSPSHITLFPPFRWPGNEEAALEKSMRAFVREASGFFLELENFDCFAPRVIFVDIVPNPELIRLQKQLEHWLQRTLNLQSKDDRPYHPHMTVAFKDLKKGVFPDAWAHFSKIKYHRIFSVQEIALLKHEDHAWKIRRIFSFV